MTFFDNYPPGSMSGRGGPNDDGCPCATCPALVPGGICDCDLETVDDDDEIVMFHNPICEFCGRCRKHCRCYGDSDDEGEVPEGVEIGDIQDAMNPERESGLEWDTGSDVASRQHAPIRRAGQNHWVTRDLANPWPGEEGMYFEEQRWADQIPPKTCPNNHQADFKPTVGTHVCQECGLIYIGGTDQWIAPRR